MSPLRLLSTILLLTNPLVTKPLVGQQRYTVTDLGVLPAGNGVYANAINDAGHIVGSAYIANSTMNIPYPFLYDGALHNLGTLGGTGGGAVGINRAGLVVGESGTPANPGQPINGHAFLYDGTLHDLGTLPGQPNSRASGINDAGKIVGASGVSIEGACHAFLYDGVMHDLGTLAGDSYSVAYAINSTGQIVGRSGSLALGYDSSHAILYDGTMHGIGTLPGFNNSSAVAINDAGQIAGYSWQQGPPGTPSAGPQVWLYDGTMHDLGVAGYSYGINDSGVVVGGLSTPPPSHAFIYYGGHVFDLNDYLDSSGAGWTLYWASGINSSGQITGTGDHNGELRAFLLTPIIDKTPPIISGMPAPGCALWPPNHKLITVATITASDPDSGLAPGSFKVTGTSNEPSSDPNNPEIVITPNGSGGYVVQLQADRLGTGTGRVYTINATATDLAGNTATAMATCTVPHDQSN